MQWERALFYEPERRWMFDPNAPIESIFACLMRGRPFGNQGKVSAALCGKTLIISFGPESQEHHYILENGLRAFRDQLRSNEELVWKGGAFFDVVTDGAKSVGGTSTGLGPLNPPVQTIIVDYLLRRIQEIRSVPQQDERDLFDPEQYR